MRRFHARPAGWPPCSPRVTARRFPTAPPGSGAACRWLHRAAFTDIEIEQRPGDVLAALYAAMNGMPT
jgi:hypothetical protein